MIILGIDPGYAIVGWGVLEYSGNSFKTLGYGSIQTPAHTDADSRLLEIYRGMKAVIEKYKPAQMAVEELFFNTNSKTAIMVAQARGVILLSARLMGVEVFEYTPLQVKQAVVGYGRAEKKTGHRYGDLNTQSESSAEARRYGGRVGYRGLSRAFGLFASRKISEITVALNFTIQAFAFLKRHRFYFTF